MRANLGRMSRIVLAAISVVLFCGPAISQQAIPTGGPIPDIRGFNDRVSDPEAVSKISIVVRHVAGKVYVVAGAGGNVVVFAGDDGILLVDTNFVVFYDQIMSAIRRISDKPIRFVVNTHTHVDHVQNNENLARQGAVVVSHPNLRAAMKRAAEATPLKGNAGFPPGGLPVVTSSEPLTFHFNGEEVVFLPLKPSHTDGDSAVYFRGSDVWAFGDVYRTDYPSLSAVGTIENFIDNYNLALGMTTPRTVFVPGHGQLSNGQDLIALRDAVIIIHDRFRELVAQGRTFEQIMEARPSREFDARFSSEDRSATTGNTIERWYRAMYAEALKEAGKQ